MKYMFTLLLVCIASLSLAHTHASEPKTVSPFEGIKLEGSGTVYLIPGNSYSVKVVENTHSDNWDKKQKNKHKMDARVEGNTLVLSGKGEVYVTFKASNLKYIALHGSGDIVCDKAMRVNDLKIQLEGSGDVDLTRLNANEVMADLTGSGDIALGGSSNTVTYNLQGSGDIEASGLKSSRALASVHGSGDISVHASETLTAKIHGNGDIHVAGNPRVSNIDTPGTGRVEEL